MAGSTTHTGKAGWLELLSQGNYRVVDEEDTAFLEPDSLFHILCVYGACNHGLDQEVVVGKLEPRVSLCGETARRAVHQLPVARVQQSGRLADRLGLVEEKDISQKKKRPMVAKLTTFVKISPAVVHRWQTAGGSEP